MSRLAWWWSAARRLGVRVVVMGTMALPTTFSLAASNPVVLSSVSIDLTDVASLQRGAALYMNYCSGCHSLKYMRYRRMARDIAITTVDGKVDEALVKQHLLFDKDATLNSNVVSALPVDDANAWFGLPIPDLSLVVRARGADWVATYLKAFYRDAQRQPWGVNNLLVPNVAMPHVLERLQGVQQRVVQAQTRTHASAEPVSLAQLRLVSSGDLTPAEFDRTVTDVVNFLTYVAEPNRQKRLALGPWVIGFLLIFVAVAALLKREYWKDVK